MTRGIRRATVRLSAQISAATGLGLVVGFVARVVTAGLLGPTSYGALRLADALQQYAGYADLGAKYSLSRQISLLLGRRQPDEAREIAGLLLTWSVVATLAVVGALWLAFAAGVSIQGLLTLPNVVALSLLFAANRANAYLANFVRGHGEFDAVGTQFFITSLLPPLVLIPGVYFLGVTGGLLSQLAVAVLVGLNLLRYARRLGILEVPWLADWTRTLGLLKLSVLLQANALSETIFESLELTVLAVLATMHDVGLYGFAIGWMTSTLAGLAGARLVIERAMLLEAGSVEGAPDARQYRRYMRAPLVLNVLVTAIALGAMYFAFDWAVAHHLPEFRPSMAVAQVMVFGQIVYASSAFPRLYFNATGQLGSRLVLVLIALALNLVLDVLLLLAGHGIFGVAMGSAISYAVYAFLVLPVCTLQTDGTRSAGVGFLIRLIGATAVTVATLVALQAWAPGTMLAPVDHEGLALLESLGVVAVKVVAYVAVALISYLVAFRSYGVGKELLAVMRTVLPQRA